MFQGCARCRAVLGAGVLALLGVLFYSFSALFHGLILVLICFFPFLFKLFGVEIVVYIPIIVLVFVSFLVCL